MTYAPNLEDLAYLVKSQPENFSSSIQTTRSIRDALANGNGNVGSIVQENTLNAHYNDYLENGGTPLTESPIPAEVDADGDGVVDEEFAAACPECTSGEPCCLREFEVSDKKASGRKITWPIPEGGPSKLFMVTKDPYSYLRNPSAEVEVKLTDKNPCKVGHERRPVTVHSNFAGGADQATDTEVMTVTNNFAVPTALSALFPEEVIYAIYVVSTYLSYNGYTASDHPSVSQYQCMSFSLPSGNVTVHPVPHVALTKMDLTGKVGCEVFLRGMPRFYAGLEGEITGEIGTQKLEYKGGITSQSAETRPAEQGPVNNPVFSILDKIYESVQKVGSGDTNQSLPRGGVPSPSPSSSVTLELSLTLGFGALTLVGKPSTPDLLLSADAGSLRLGLTVTGKVNLLELLTSRVPGLKEALDSLADTDNAGRVELVCNLTLKASGGIQAGIQNAVEITISSKDGWEADFDQVQNVFQADAKITGTLEVKATVGVDTWFFEGAAGVEASVSTGWHFGGRQIENSDGTQKTETLYFFEGLRLKGKYYVEAGNTSANSNKTRRTFETGSDDTTGTTTRTSSSGVSTRLIERSFDESFWASEGSPNDWKEHE